MIIPHIRDIFICGILGHYHKWLRKIAFFEKKSWQRVGGSGILRLAPETGEPGRRSTRKKHRKRWKKELTRERSCDRIASALARAGGGPWKPNSVTSKVKEKVSRNERSFAAELEQGLSNPKNSNEDNRRESMERTFNREFDPGSGWTLAARLTHASRAEFCAEDFGWKYKT